MRQILCFVLAVVVALGCSKDDGVGAYSISGSPEITSLEGGYMRAIATWNINTTSDDASLTNIYWDNGNSSTGQYLSATEGNTVTVEITDLAEGEYTFYVQNATPTSNKYSAPSESVTIYVYGDTYCKNLAQRSISSTAFVAGDADGVGEKIEVTWGSAPSSSDCIGNYLYYYNRLGEDVATFCSIDESVSSVEDAIVDTEFDYATLYKPSGCVDTLVSTSVSGETFPMSSDGIIRVSSLVAMQPYFAMDSVHVVLETGDYTVTASDVTAGYYQGYGPLVSEIYEETVEGDGTSTFTGTGVGIIEENDYIHSLFLAEGNYSTYDFGGSTVTVSTYAYDVSGYEAYPIRFIGNGNTIKNLTQIDDGELQAIHSNGITNCVMDGADNTLENVEIRARGSWPYGYGEIFGKGGGYVVQHFKHCSLLMRGDRNSVKGCTLIHRAYGHGLFMQGGEDMLIEDTYVEGQMKTTNQIIEELQDPSALGYGCLTVWGYPVETIAGYTLCLNEDGIRTYNSGVTIIDGKPYGGRTTSNVTVRRCTVKNMRAGISLTLGHGAKWVEDTHTYGCDRGLAIGTEATITSCYADCQYGPAYGVDYESNRDINVDFTLMPDQSESEIDGFVAGNGSKQVAFIRGTRHKVHIKADPSLTTTSGLYIQVGGDNTSVGELYEKIDASVIDDSYACNNVIINETSYPILLAGEVSTAVDHGSIGDCLTWNNRIASVGSVVVNSSNQDLHLGKQKAVCDGLNTSEISSYYDWLDLDLTGESTSRP